MLEHQLDALDRMARHRKRSPQAVVATPAAALTTRVVAAAATTAVPTTAAVAQVATPAGRGHITFVTSAGTTRRVWVSAGQSLLTDTVIESSESVAATPRTTAVAVTTAPTAVKSTAARVASSSAKGSASSASSSAARSSVSSPSAAESSKESSSGVSGGAVAGIIIAVLAVAIIAAGAFFWRRKRNARLARGTGLIAGDHSPDLGGAGANAGAYKKQHETADSGLFAGSSASPMWGGDAGEKGMQQYGAMDRGSGVGTIPAGVWPPPPPQSQQSHRESFTAPSFASSAPYPPAGAANAWPNSSANLLAGAAAAPRAMSPFADPHHDSIEQREMQQELENERQQQAQAQAAAAVAAAAASPTPSAGPFAESEGQGEIRIVKGTFVPTLEDELIFEPGDRVQVLMKYDDGWALGLNLSSAHPPAKGVFPFECLGEVVPLLGPSSTPVPTPAPAATPAPAPAPAPLAAPIPAALQPAQLAPVNPANIPLPPPTPTSLEPITEDADVSAPQAVVVSASPPQLAPLALDRNDSPLSASFPASVAHAPTAVAAGLAAASVEPKNKRASSLIASRDADLFVALGEVLDKKGEDEPEAGAAPAASLGGKVAEEPSLI
ncbi:hypothetical protein JCM3770_003835 [Rhodotorula araucariae]